MFSCQYTHDLDNSKHFVEITDANRNVETVIFGKTKREVKKKTKQWLWDNKKGFPVWKFKL